MRFHKPCKKHRKPVDRSTEIVYNIGDVCVRKVSAAAAARNKARKNERISGQRMGRIYPLPPSGSLHTSLGPFRHAHPVAGLFICALFGDSTGTGAFCAYMFRHDRPFRGPLAGLRLRPNCLIFTVHNPSFPRATALARKDGGFVMPCPLRDTVLPCAHTVSL
jgi:hypothetical protein